MGCAKDIVEQVGVPRFLFSDFPLGNPAGRPNDLHSQDFTLELALRVLEAAPAPRTTVQSPLRWSADPAWKLDYSNIARLSLDEIARRRTGLSRGRRLRGPAGRAPRPGAGAGPCVFSSDFAFGALPMFLLLAVHPAFFKPDLISAVPDPSIPIRLHFAPPRRPFLPC